MQPFQTPEQDALQLGAHLLHKEGVIRAVSNNVIDFMESEGYFRFKADYSISSKEFYDIYKQWCEDNACHSVSAIRFSAELRQNDRRYNLESTNNIYLPGGRRVRGFVGIEPLVHPCP